MALPTRGQSDWDDEIAGHVAGIEAAIASVAAASEQARSNATSAISIAQGAAAKVDAFRSIPDVAVASLVGDGVSATAVALAARYAATDGTPRTMRSSGDGLDGGGKFDWGHAGTGGYLTHWRAEAGSGGYISAYGTDQGAAGAVLMSLKNSGPGLWVSSNPSHTSSGIRVQQYQRGSVAPVQIDVFEGASGLKITGNRGAGYPDGVANGTTTFTSATAAFTAGDTGKALTQLTSRGEGFVIPAGVTITYVNATTVTMSAPATGTATGINFLVSDRVPSDAQVLFEVVNKDAAPVARIRQNTASDWYQPINVTAGTGSTQNTITHRSDGHRFHRYISGSFKTNAIITDADGSLKFIGYDDSATVGAETGAATVFTFKKNQLAFFGGALTTKPTGVAVTAAGVHAALVTLGLIGA